MTTTTTPETTPADLLAGVPCPLCNGEEQMSLMMSDCDTFHCHGCNDEFTVADLESRLAGYARLVRTAKAARAAMTADPS